MAALYGNLVIFKERSIHRIAVQSQDPPYSRTDEVSNNIGCIAPNSLISINNELFFLSWGGLMRFDNGSIKRADGQFAAELQLKLNRLQRRPQDSGYTRNPAIRDCSVAYNQTFNELYANIPIARRNERIDDPARGSRGYINRAHVYVIQLDTGLCTTFQYEMPPLPGSPFIDPSSGLEHYPPDIAQGRIYYTNTQGELRSADIVSYSTGPALTYTEAPTDVFRDSVTNHSVVPPGGSFAPSQRPIHTTWRSKHFPVEDKTVVKRAIKAILGVVKAQNEVRIVGDTSSDVYQNRISNFNRPGDPSTYTHSYNPEDFGAGELTSVPPSVITQDSFGDALSNNTRGERLMFEIQSSEEFCIDSFVVHWKPMNTYVR
jgi:hypothetical protein